MPILTKYHKHLRYVTSGATPKLLLLSGIHGNEYESGRIFRSLVGKLALPDFLYIPVASPTAVKDRSRTNQQNHDLNRQFIYTTTDQEALRIMDLLKPHQFSLAIDIHEDPDRSQSLYAYDSGKLTETELERFREAIHTSGARAYTGIDDFEDKNLGLQVEKGYVSMSPEDIKTEPGFFLIWSAKNHIVNRGFTLEIPGKASPQLKKSILATLIPFLVQFGV